MNTPSHFKGLWALFAVALGLTTVCASADPSLKRIAITFDDAPRAAGPLMSHDARTKMLIDSLAGASIDGAMFFATTRNLDARGAEGIERLKRYADAGHRIANHSHAHRSANRESAEVFLLDVERANQVLAKLPGYAPYFRFPFLHEGDTVQKRDDIRAGLSKLGLNSGYVTIDNYDWYLQALLDEAVSSKHPLDLDGWRDLYVDTLVEAATFYNDVAVRTLNRSPAHTLLLHENDLAALFIDDLAAALRHEGWEIIPALEAYADPIAANEPETMLLNQGRVVALAKIAGADNRSLFHPLETESVLRALAVRRGLMTTAAGAYLDQAPPGLTPQRFAPGIVSLPDQYEYGSVFSADGRELYFGVAIDGRGEIRSMRYDDGNWSAPEVVFTHEEHSYGDPYLSRDESRLYFISNRPVSGMAKSETHDLWYARRTRNGWSAPINLGLPINTAADEFYTSFTDNGTLAFASKLEAKNDGDLNLYLSEERPGGFAPPQRLPAPVNTAWYEADPFIAPDGSYILFASNRRASLGLRDLFVTFANSDGGWSDPVSLGDRVNTPGLELCPFVSRDGRYLFYTSDKDIYWVDAAVIELAREGQTTAH